MQVFTVQPCNDDLLDAIPAAVKKSLTNFKPTKFVYKKPFKRSKTGKKKKIKKKKNIQKKIKK